MLNLREHIIFENYASKQPQECLRHALRVMQSRHDQSSTLKSIAILALFALLNSTSDRKIKSMVPTLLSHLADL